ncbi:MAG: HD-GYP domain-containing protein [Synergistetes bacterium]|nr:HD-GYP domain-containing protein [Synergistota bacterium]
MKIRDLLLKTFFKVFLMAFLLFFGAVAIVVYMNYESYGERTTRLISGVVADMMREYLRDVARVEDKVDIDMRAFLPMASSLIDVSGGPKKANLGKLREFFRFKFSLFVFDQGGRLINSLYPGKMPSESLMTFVKGKVKRGEVKKTELSFFKRAYFYFPRKGDYILAITFDMRDFLEAFDIPTLPEFISGLKARYSFIDDVKLVQVLGGYDDGSEKDLELARRALNSRNIKRLKVSWSEEKIYIPLDERRRIVLVVLFHKTALPLIIFRTITGMILAMLMVFLSSALLSKRVISEIVSPIESLERKVGAILSRGKFEWERSGYSGEIPQEIAKLEEAISSLVESIDLHVRRLSETNERLMRLADVLLLFDPWVEEKRFMEEVLSAAMRFVPEADRGSIYVVRDGKIRCVAQTGYSDRVLEAEFDVDQLVLAGEEPRVIDKIAEKTKDEKVKAFLKSIGSSDIKKTLCVGLFFRAKYYGGIFLDTTKEEMEFSQASIRFIKVFGKLISSFVTLKELLREERRFYLEVISVLVRSLELRDPYTAGHSERVAKLASELAKRLGLSHEEVEKVMWAGILHDVGKLGVPDAVLNKPGRLSPEEFEKIKKHPVLSERLVRESSALRDLAPAVKHHHERWDGKGYPDGLKGEEIPLWARIIALADAFDAMTSDRIYRRRKSVEEAIRELEKGKGSQVDPKLTDIFIDMIKETGGV